MGGGGGGVEGSGAHLFCFVLLCFALFLLGEGEIPAWTFLFYFYKRLYVFEQPRMY